MCYLDTFFFSLCDETILIDSCWALAYLSERSDVEAEIRLIVEAGCCPRYIELLNHPSTQVIQPALRAIGNIAAGKDSQAQVLLELNLLPSLLCLLSHNSRRICLEALWTISNILAGNCAMIDSVFDAKLIEPVISLLAVGNLEIQKEACWSVINVFKCGASRHVHYIAQQVLPILLQVLNKHVGVPGDERVCKATILAVEAFVSCPCLNEGQILNYLQHLNTQILEEKLTAVMLHSNPEAAATAARALFRVRTVTNHT